MTAPAKKERTRRLYTIHQQFLLTLIGVNMLVMSATSVIFYREKKAALLGGIDDRLTAVARMARELLPADYHDQLDGPESVSDEAYQRLVDRYNRLCVDLGLEYIWSLLQVDGQIVFTSSTSPDKVAANRLHAKFFEPHSNPALYTNTFETMRVTCQSNSDKWGDIRVVLIPSNDARGRKYLFGSSVRLAEVDSQLRGLVWQSLAVGLAVFVLSMVVGLWVSRLVILPLHRLTETIRTIAAGDAKTQACESGSYEQVMLARHFNRLNRALQEKIGQLEHSRTRLLDQRDVERRQAEEDLVMSEQRYRGLLNFAVDGILVGSRDGTIIDTNECMCRIFGLPRHEIVGKHISAMPFTAESIRAKPWRYDLLQRGETVVNERTVRRPDGSEVIIEMHTKVMPDGTYQSIYHEITERKRAEDALRETRRLLDEAQSMARLGAWKYEVASGHITWTDEVYRIHGVGQDFDTNDLTRAINFYAPESRPALTQAMKRAVELGEPFDLELEFIRANGERIWVRSCGRANLKDGQTVSVNGSFMDINERKLAEAQIRLGHEKLTRQYEMLSALLENLTVGVYMAEASSGETLVYNNAALQLMGRRMDAATGVETLIATHSVLRADDRTDYPAAAMPIMLALQGVSSKVDDMVVIRPDGTEVLLEVCGSPVRDEHGNVWAGLVSFADITERKRVERALRDSEDRYRQLFEMESDAIFLIDNRTGQLLDVNQAAQTLYGYSREELLGLRNVDLSAEQAQTAQATRDAMQAGNVHFRIALRRHRKKDGAVFPVEITVRTFEIHGHSVHIAAIRDITERVQAQELLESWNNTLSRRVAERTREVEQYARKLQALTERLVRVEEEERRRISDVLHEDLQQTLAAVRMTLGGAAQTVKSADTREMLERVDLMLEQSIRLTRSLVHDIAVPGVREGDVVFAAGWLSKIMQDKFGLTVELLAEGLVPVIGENVYLCLFRTMQELLFNVVKHAKVKHASLAIRMEEGRYLRVTVCDRGCGISGDTADSNGASNRGFGLFSVRERIEGLGGSMSVNRGEDGRGTIVVLRVPVNG